MTEDAPARSPRGEMLADISNAIVGLLKESYGKGPERARVTYHGDLLVIVLRGGFTRVEQTLLDAGRGASVLRQREDFHVVMRHQLDEVIERHTGRKVVASMVGSHQDPDLTAQVFILEPVDDDDLLAPDPRRR